MNRVSHGVNNATNSEMMPMIRYASDTACALPRLRYMTIGKTDVRIPRAMASIAASPANPLTPGVGVCRSHSGIRR